MYLKESHSTLGFIIIQPSLQRQTDRRLMAALRRSAYATDDNCHRPLSVSVHDRW